MQCYICGWSRDEEPVRSFFKFPSNRNDKRKWLDLIGDTDRTLTRTSEVCSIHFNEDCFENRRGKAGLKSGSKPSLFLDKDKLPDPQNEVVTQTEIKSGKNVGAELQLNSERCSDVVIMRCCVDGCGVDSGTDKFMSFYKIPKTKVLRQRWLKMIRCSPDIEDGMVCSSHFLETDFRLVKGTIILKSNVVPSVFSFRQQRKSSRKRARVDTYVSDDSLPRDRAKSSDQDDDDDKPSLNDDDDQVGDKPSIGGDDKIGNRPSLDDDENVDIEEQIVATKVAKLCDGKRGRLRISNKADDISTTKDTHIKNDILSPSHNLHSITLGKNIVVESKTSQGITNNKSKHNDVNKSQLSIEKSVDRNLKDQSTNKVEANGNTEKLASTANKTDNDDNTSRVSDKIEKGVEAKKNEDKPKETDSDKEVIGAVERIFEKSVNNTDITKHVDLNEASESVKNVVNTVLAQEVNKDDSITNTNILETEPNKDETVTDKPLDFSNAKIANKLTESDNSDTNKLETAKESIDSVNISEDSQDTQDGLVKSLQPESIICNVAPNLIRSPSPPESPDCLMILETVEVDVDPAQLMMMSQQSDDDSDVEIIEKKTESVSLLTSSDESDVILQEPHIDTVDVSDETDEDDVPLTRYAEVQAALQKKLKDIFWGHKSELYCYLCQFTTKSKAKLKDHMKTHSSNREKTMLVCSLCPYQTSSQKPFDRHLRKHKEEKKFRCHLCDYKAKHQMSLVYHLESHKKKKKSFLCTKCAFKCKDEDSIKQHLKDAHKVNNYKCKCCSYTSKKRNDVKRHVKRIHPDDYDEDYVPGREV